MATPVSIVMCMKIFIKIFQKVQEFGPRQSLDQRHMACDNPLGYILSISNCMQNFITMFHLVQEIWSFIFQNMELDKASTDDKFHSEISWARFANIKVYANDFQIFQMV